MPNFVLIGQTILDFGDMAVFDFSRWWPSAIFDLFYVCLPTHEEYLLVFVTVQNLFGLGAIVSIIC